MCAKKVRSGGISMGSQNFRAVAKILKKIEIFLKKIGKNQNIYVKKTMKNEK
jgi:hypothetical protein